MNAPDPVLTFGIALIVAILYVAAIAVHDEAAISDGIALQNGLAQLIDVGTGVRK